MCGSIRKVSFSDRCLTVVCSMKFLVAFTFLVLLSFLAIIAVGISTHGTKDAVGPMTLVVDCDAGTDDAMAIMLILEAVRRFHNAETKNGPNLLAITTVNGNTDIHNVTRNVLRVLKVENRLDIPVYKGASRSLKYTPSVGHYFGMDGLGDVPDPDAPSLDVVQKEHAAVALARMASERPGELTVIALGPLTNIAMAIRLDENFLNNLKHLYILGGATEGRGNKIPGVEFNFYMDAEANYVVLHDTNYDNSSISLLAWEQVEKMNIKQEWRASVLGALNSDRIKFLNEVEHISTVDPESPWDWADPALAMIVMLPSLGRRHDKLAVVALTQGEARGGIVVDYYRKLKDVPTVDLISDVDVESYKTLVLDYFK